MQPTFRRIFIKCQTFFLCCSSQDSEQKDYINMKGCVPQFEKWLQDNLTLVAGIFIGVALLQVGFPNGREALLFLGHRLTSPFIHRFLGFVWPRTW